MLISQVWELDVQAGYWVTWFLVKTLLLVADGCLLPVSSHDLESLSELTGASCAGTNPSQGPHRYNLI